MKAVALELASRSADVLTSNEANHTGQFADVAFTKAYGRKLKSLVESKPVLNNQVVLQSTIYFNPLIQSLYSDYLLKSCKGATGGLILVLEEVGNG
jgi:hypothetical protein